MKNFRASLRHGAWVAALFFAPAALRADHQDFVVISATASKAYTERKSAEGSAKPESYALFQGKFFNGLTRDPSIDHATFTAIAKTLAPDLARQNYLPAPSAPVADLLIVVNWGTTTTDPTTDKNNPEFQFALQDLLTSTSAQNNALSPQAAMSQLSVMSQQSAMGYNSHLLGYDAPLQREGRMDWARSSGVSAMEDSHLAELIDERYFVILMAYDYRRIQQDKRDYELARASRVHGGRPTPPPQPKPVWIVRMNIRASGSNFGEALTAMGREAANYFGKQLDDLVDAPAVVGQNAHVEIGPTKVLGPAK
jgi:hypothetical protein